MPEPPALHRGPLIPQFPPQSLDLPSITISRNMMDQEGVSVNNGHPVVSTTIHSPLVNQEVYLFCATREMLSSFVNTQKSCTSAAPVCVLLVAAAPDMVCDASKLKDMIFKYIALDSPDIRSIPSLNEPFYWTVMSPSQFSYTSCCQCIWHSIWPCLQHRRYMITMSKCHDIMLLTVRISFLKSTLSVDDPPFVRWADVNRSQVLEYKAHSCSRRTVKMGPKSATVSHAHI